MRIKKIRINNFKNISLGNVELNDFNILLGANASGKTNFISAVQFFYVYMNYGLRDACNFAGGYSNIFSKQLSKKGIEIGFDFTPDLGKESIDPSIITSAELLSVSSSLRIERTSADRDPDYVHRLRFTFLMKKNDQQKKQGKITWLLQYGIKNGVRVYESTKRGPKSDDIEMLYDVFQSFKDESLGADSLNDRIRTLLVNLVVDDFKIGRTSFYRLDPVITKRPVEFELGRHFKDEVHGGEFVNLLNNFSSAEKTSYLRIVKSFFPSIIDYKIENTESAHRILYVIERYSNQEVRIPSFDVSDGTIVVLTLIAHLQSKSSKQCFIEEPERYIHPRLIARLMRYLAESSKSKQIILTTHSPVVVDAAAPSNIMVVERNADDGLSTIRQVKDIPRSAIDELGLGELFLSGAL